MDLLMWRFMKTRNSHRAVVLDFVSQNEEICIQRRENAEKRTSSHMQHSQISRLPVESIIRVFERRTRHEMKVCPFLVATFTFF